jgi:hypothetical protein
MSVNKQRGNGISTYKYAFRPKNGSGSAKIWVTKTVHDPKSSSNQSGLFTDIASELMTSAIKSAVYSKKRKCRYSRTPATRRNARWNRSLIYR